MIRYLILLLTINTAWANHEEALQLQEFINASNLFAASFYNQTKQQKQSNFLISPYSAEAVLAFVQSGCKGETAQEVRNTLHLPDDKGKVETLINKSISVLKGNDLYTLHTANKMYVREDFPIKEEFKKAATEIYHADIENINFVQNEIAAKTMNDWVENQTNNRIKDLISSDVLDASTASILINAVYFKANWSRSFAQDGTRKNDFYKTKQDVVQVDTMYLNKEWLNYYESPELDAKFLEMRFKGGEASMVIALPNEKDGLDTLENQIENVFASQNFEPEYMHVQLPKFKIESRLPLKNTLKNLGIKKLFDRQQADLSGIAGLKGDLVVTTALQKTYIKVEEGGVEAASSTYIQSSPRCCAIPTKPFIVNHPFIFYIKAKDFIIFAGRYSGPEQ